MKIKEENLPIRSGMFDTCPIIESDSVIKKRLSDIDGFALRYAAMKLVKEMHKVNKVVSVQTGKPYEEDLSEQVEEIEPVLNKEKSSNEYKKNSPLIFVGLSSFCSEILITLVETLLQ